MVFVSGTGIAFPFHEVLTIHVIFADAVENDMDMDVAGAVVAVFVSADYGLMSRKVLFGIFQSDCLRLFYGQSCGGCIFRIEADDVVVGFDVVVFLIFAVLVVEVFAFDVKGGGIAFNSFDQEVLPHDKVTVLVVERSVGELVVLEHEVL